MITAKHAHALHAWFSDGEAATEQCVVQAPRAGMWITAMWARVRAGRCACYGSPCDYHGIRSATPAPRASVDRAAFSTCSTMGYGRQGPRCGKTAQQPCSA